MDVRTHLLVKNEGKATAPHGLALSAAGIAGLAAAQQLSRVHPVATTIPPEVRFPVVPCHEGKMYGVYKKKRKVSTPSRLHVYNTSTTRGGEERTSLFHNRRSRTLDNMRASCIPDRHGVCWVGKNKQPNNWLVCSTRSFLRNKPSRTPAYAGNLLHTSLGAKHDIKISSGRTHGGNHPPLCGVFLENPHARRIKDDTRRCPNIRDSLSLSLSGRNLLSN